MRESANKNKPKRQNISVRVPTKILARLKRLMNRSNANMSQVIIAALEQYCADPEPSQLEKPYEYWKRSGLIGSINKPNLAATDYKEIIGSSLEHKHGNR